jgi:hypothetical protein
MLVFGPAGVQCPMPVPSLLPLPLLALFSKRLLLAWVYCYSNTATAYSPSLGHTVPGLELMFRHSSHPGNGKSTLINALISLAYEDYQAKAIANGAQTHVTRKTDVHAFEQNAGFAFIDTFGLTKVWAWAGRRLSDQ